MNLECLIDSITKQGVKLEIAKSGDNIYFVDLTTSGIKFQTGTLTSTFRSSNVDLKEAIKDCVDQQNKKVDRQIRYAQNLKKIEI